MEVQHAGVPGGPADRHLTKRSARLDEVPAILWSIQMTMVGGHNKPGAAIEFGCQIAKSALDIGKGVPYLIAGAAIRMGSHIQNIGIEKRERRLRRPANPVHNDLRRCRQVVPVVRCSRGVPGLVAGVDAADDPLGMDEKRIAGKTRRQRACRENLLRRQPELAERNPVPRPHVRQHRHRILDLRNVGEPGGHPVLRRPQPRGDGRKSNAGCRRERAVELPYHVRTQKRPRRQLVNKVHAKPVDSHEHQMLRLADLARYLPSPRTLGQIRGPGDSGNGEREINNVEFVRIGTHQRPGVERLQQPQRVFGQRRFHRRMVHPPCSDRPATRDPNAYAIPA